MSTYGMEQGADTIEKRLDFYQEDLVIKKHSLKDYQQKPLHFYVERAISNYFMCLGGAVPSELYELF